MSTAGRDIEPTEPEARGGVPQEQEDLMRSGLAPFSAEDREKFGRYLSQLLQRNGRIGRFEMPPELRLTSNEERTKAGLPKVPESQILTPEERGAVGRALEHNPERAIEIIRRPPEATMGEVHPVLARKFRRASRCVDVVRNALPKRHALRHWRKAEAGPLKVKQDLPPQRTGKVLTGMERAFGSSTAWLEGLRSHSPEINGRRCVIVLFVSTTYGRLTVSTANT